MVRADGKADINDRMEFSEEVVVRDYGRYFIGKQFNRNIGWHWDEKQNEWKKEIRSNWKCIYTTYDREDDFINCYSCLKDAERELKQYIEESIHDLDENEKKAFLDPGMHFYCRSMSDGGHTEIDLYEISMFHAEWLMKQIQNDRRQLMMRVETVNRNGDCNCYQYDPREGQYIKLMVHDHLTDRLLSKRNRAMEDMKKTLNKRLERYKETKQGSESIRKEGNHYEQRD